MSYTLYYLPRVEDDLSGAMEYYYSKQVGLDLSLHKQFLEAIDYIKKHPLAFQMRYGSVRFVLLKSFPYFIAFEVVKNEIIIHAMICSLNDPNEWPKP